MSIEGRQNELPYLLAQSKAWIGCQLSETSSALTSAGHIPPWHLPLAKDGKYRLHPISLWSVKLRGKYFCYYFFSRLLNNNIKFWQAMKILSSWHGKCSGLMHSSVVFWWTLCSAVVAVSSCVP